jgi:hypothetical protein
MRFTKSLQFRLNRLIRTYKCYDKDEIIYQGGIQLKNKFLAKKVALVLVCIMTTGALISCSPEVENIVVENPPEIVENIPIIVESPLITYTKDD